MKLFSVFVLTNMIKAYRELPYSNKWQRIGKIRLAPHKTHTEYGSKCIQRIYLINILEPWKTCMLK